MARTILREIRLARACRLTEAEVSMLLESIVRAEP